MSELLLIAILVLLFWSGNSLIAVIMIFVILYKYGLNFKPLGSNSDHNH